MKDFIISKEDKETFDKWESLLNKVVQINDSKFLRGLLVRGAHPFPHASKLGGYFLYNNNLSGAKPLAPLAKYPLLGDTSYKYSYCVFVFNPGRRVKELEYKNIKEIT